MVYLIALIFLLFSIYAFDYKKSQRGATLAYIVILIYMIAIVALRYRIGGDSIGYEIEYRKMPGILDIEGFMRKTRWEPGFVIFAALCRSVTSDFTFFQLMHAIVVNVIVFWFIYNNTQNRFTAVTFYLVLCYLNLNTEVLREALAVSVFLLAWPYFRNGKWLYYYLLALLATTFHISAIFTLMLPIFTLPGVREIFKLGYRTIFICITVFIIGYIIQRKFFAVLELLSQNATVSERAQVYAKSSFGGMQLNIIGMLELAFQQIVLPLLAIWYLKKRVIGDKDSREYRWFRKLEIMVVAGAYISVLTMFVFIMGRFRNYVLLFEIVAMASCFFLSVRIRDKKFRLGGLNWGMIFFLVLISNLNAYFAPTFGSASNKRYMLYYPYNSRIDNEEDPQREEILRYGRHIQ